MKTPLLEGSGVFTVLKGQAASRSWSDPTYGRFRTSWRTSTRKHSKNTDISPLC